MIVEKISQIFNDMQMLGILAALFCSYFLSRQLMGHTEFFAILLLYTFLVISFQNRLELALYGYIFSVFFIPPTIGVETKSLLLNIDRLILIVIVGSWLMMLFRNKVKLRSTPVDLGFALFIITLGMSILWNIETIASNGKLAVCIKKLSVTSLERILIVYIVMSIFTTREGIKKVLSFIMLCVSVIAAYGIFESTVRYNIFVHVATIKNPEVLRAALSEAIRFGLYRAKSTQVLPHIFGTALSMILPLQIYHFLYKEGRSRIMAVIGIILTLGGIAVTYTRGVYLACGLGISLSFLCLKSISKKMMFIALIGCLLFVVLYNPRVISFCSEYLLKLLNPSTIAFDREHSMESRISDYAFTADRLKNRLFLGQGYGTYESGVGFDKYVDNSYLYNLIETGVIGFLAFLFLIYGIIFKTGRLLTKYQYYDSDIYMCRFMHIGLIVFFFQCLTYDAFGFAGASKLFWVLFGLLLALYNIAKKDMGREHAAVS